MECFQDSRCRSQDRADTLTSNTAEVLVIDVTKVNVPTKIFTHAPEKWVRPHSLLCACCPVDSRRFHYLNSVPFGYVGFIRHPVKRLECVMLRGL